MDSVRLRLGRVAYAFEGPADGPLVVLVHGGTLPMWLWDRQVPALAAAGYRTLRYDLFGQGASDAPRVAYDRDLFRSQLLELLGALKVASPVHLVGFAFGGAIAANFAARHPDRVRSLALVAPLLHYERGSAAVRAVRLPWLGGLLLRAVVLPALSSRVQRLWAGERDDARYRALYRQQTARPGYRAAMTSRMRTDALGDYSGAYRTVGGAGCPALLTWGGADATVPAAHTRRIRQLMPRADAHEIPGADHGLAFGASAPLNARLLAHLEKSADLASRTAPP